MDVSTIKNARTHPITKYTTGETEREIECHVLMRVADVATTMCRYLEYFHASKVYVCVCDDGVDERDRETTHNHNGKLT